MKNIELPSDFVMKNIEIGSKLVVCKICRNGLRRSNITYKRIAKHFIDKHAEVLISEVL